MISSGDALQEHLSLRREAQAALRLFAHHAIADYQWQGTLELESVELEWMVRSTQIGLKIVFMVLKVRYWRGYIVYQPKNKRTRFALIFLYSFRASIDVFDFWKYFDIISITRFFYVHRSQHPYFGVASTFPFLQQTYTGPAAHHTHNITSQEPPAKPADCVPDRLGDPVKFSLMDWQWLAERLSLEDSCHGKHLKVLVVVFGFEFWDVSTMHRVC